MTVVQLDLGPEFRVTPPAVEEQIREVLAGQPPAFFSFVDGYEELYAIANEARHRLDELVDRSDPASLNYDGKLAEFYTTQGREHPDDPRVQEYKYREGLRESFGSLIDANSILKKHGDLLARHIKPILGPGIHSLGANFYCVEFDPRYIEHPGRLNFYRLGSEEYPVAFGGNIAFDPIKEPLRPAAAPDIVMLVRDLQAYLTPSQPK